MAIAPDAVTAEIEPSDADIMAAIVKLGEWNQWVRRNNLGGGRMDVQIQIVSALAIEVLALRVENRLLKETAALTEERDGLQAGLNRTAADLVAVSAQYTRLSAAVNALVAADPLNGWYLTLPGDSRNNRFIRFMGRLSALIEVADGDGDGEGEAMPEAPAPGPSLRAAAEIARLRTENADLRRAVPVINSDASVTWPSVHDNPTVLRAMFFERSVELEALQSRIDAALALHPCVTFDGGALRGEHAQNCGRCGVPWPCAEVDVLSGDTP